MDWPNGAGCNFSRFLTTSTSLSGGQICPQSLHKHPIEGAEDWLVPGLQSPQLWCVRIFLMFSSVFCIPPFVVKFAHQRPNNQSPCPESNWMTSWASHHTILSENSMLRINLFFFQTTAVSHLLPSFCRWISVNNVFSLSFCYVGLDYVTHLKSNHPLSVIYGPVWNDLAK